MASFISSNGRVEGATLQAREYPTRCLPGDLKDLEGAIAEILGGDSNDMLHYR